MMKRLLQRITGLENNFESGQSNSVMTAMDDRRGKQIGNTMTLPQLNGTSLWTNLFPEIWSHIFILCMPSTEFVGISIKQPPLLLGHICRLWRSIAFGTPQLWNRIYLSVHKGNLSNQESHTKAWLARSGDLPLSISVYDPQPLPGLMNSSFLDVIIAVCSRWQTVKLNIPLASISKLLGGNPPSTMPLLGSLELCFTADSTFQGPITISPSAPNLSKIHLRTGTYINKKRLIFPWSQLTEYAFTSPLDVAGYFQIITSCTQIRVLSLRTEWGSPGVVPFTPHFLPYLQSLHLCPSGEADILLDGILAPALRQIRLDLYSYGGTPDDAHEWPKRALHALISRSGCHLEQLVLHGKSVPGDDLEELIGKAPELVDIVATYQGKDIIPGYISDMLAERVKVLAAGKDSF